jgi:hypothetical protein
MREFQFFIEGKGDMIDKSIMSKLNIPILLFDSDEIRSKHSYIKARIFIHSEKMHERNILLEPNFYKNHFAIKIELNMFCTDDVESAREITKINDLRKTIK